MKVGWWWPASWFLILWSMLLIQFMSDRSPFKALHNFSPEGVFDLNASRRIEEPILVTEPPLDQAKLTVKKPGDQQCWLQFSEYVSSPWEIDWLTNIRSYQDNVCEHSNGKPELTETWVKTITALSEKPVKDADPEVFSHIVFKNNCTGETLIDYIEPLQGLNRHPYFCKSGGAYVVDKGYIWVSWETLATTKPVLDSFSGKMKTKSYYFDLGASVYNEGAGGASQQWMVEVYEKRGIQWDGIYCWEAQAWAPGEVWNRLPAKLRPIYHWYNVPTNPEKGHPDNALEILQQVAKPEDFVLLKIDIDNTPIEESFLNQILGSPELMALIDDFYFEHHVNVGPMNPYHGTHHAPQRLEDTYRIFTTLRKHGIRAHQWV